MIYSGSTMETILEFGGSNLPLETNRGTTKQTCRRSVILILITVLMGGTYVMENPHNSLLAMHPRYVWLLEQLKKFGVFAPHSMEQILFFYETLWEEIVGIATPKSSISSISNFHMKTTIDLHTYMFFSCFESSLVDGQPTTKTYKIAFWMRKYSSLSWKRTWCWSNSPLISALDLGALTKTDKAGSQTTTTRYRDAKGRVKFKGNKHLKASQCLI